MGNIGEGYTRIGFQHDTTYILMFLEKGKTGRRFEPSRTIPPVIKITGIPSKRIMNLESYFNKLKNDFPDINLPDIFEAEDYNESQLKINGIWTNYLYGCGVIQKNDRYVYLETDQERGYVSVVKEFENKKSLEQYVCNRFTIIANASRDSNSKEEMAVRFVQQKYKYSEKQSRRMVAQIAKHKEIFEEFFNYARVGRFCKKDKSQTQVHGYTAEFLSKEYNLSPLGAYNYLVYLIEDPERALADVNYHRLKSVACSSQT